MSIMHPGPCRQPVEIGRRDARSAIASEHVPVKRIEKNENSLHDRQSFMPAFMPAFVLEMESACLKPWCPMPR
jgi:hypothetical protein